MFIGVVGPQLYVAVAALFHIGIDLAVSVYYSSKYDDKEWQKIKSFGIFTKLLKNAMKNNTEMFKKTD